MRESGNKPEAPLMRFKPGTIRRLLGYMSQYRVQLVLVVICILVSAFANAASALFLQQLIDDYIAPLLLESNPVFTGLAKAMTTMACVYAAGVLCTLFYNRLMAVVAQGTLKRIRDEMFNHMQTLPIA